MSCENCDSMLDEQYDFCVCCGLEIDHRIEPESPYSKNICYTCSAYDKTKRFIELLNVYNSIGEYFIPFWVFGAISNYAQSINKPVSFELINSLISFSLFKKYKIYIPYLVFIYTKKKLINMCDDDINKIIKMFDLFQVEFFRLRLRNNSLNLNFLVYHFIYHLGYRTELKYIKQLKADRIKTHLELYKKVCRLTGWHVGVWG